MVGDDFGVNRMAKKVMVEPSFRMEPRTKFSADRARAVIDRILHSRLEKQHYDPFSCVDLTKMLAYEIKIALKDSIRVCLRCWRCCC